MLDLIIAAALAASSASVDHAHQHDHHHAMSDASSTVAADVRTVDAEARRALMRHEAMPELSMPSMVMEFAIAADVDITLFEPGAALTITVINGENGLEVIAAEPEMMHGHSGH